MTVRARAGLAVAAAVAGLALPAAAFAHAYPVATVPEPSGVVATPPAAVSITYDEAVEPRFAIISVTDRGGHRVTAGPVSRSPANPDMLVVPLRPHLPKGWYLVYWRVVSIDGHPVQGAFTFAVGRSPGPAPQFVIPHVAGSATTPRLVVARWAVFLTVMAAIGLFFMRVAIARPAVRRVEGTSLRPLSVAFVAVSVLGLLAIPVYVELATAEFSLRSVFDVGALVPLWRVSAFGRGYVDLEVCFALFCVAAWIALWVDRPERDQRSIAEILAGIGAVATAAAVAFVPGAAGHAAQTPPRAVAVMLDWLHVVSGALWIGGLAGLLVLWRGVPPSRRAGVLAVAVPRFSNVALVSVAVLLGSGIGASVLHLPIVAALWLTTYGKTILAKAALLAAAMALAAVNLVRSRRRLLAARDRPELGRPAALLLRRLVGGEAVLLVVAVLAAALLSSLAPPPPALAKEGSAVAKVGPGPVAATLHEGGYDLRVRIAPNRAAAPSTFTLELSKGGSPVSGASVTLTFAMLDMEMGNQEYQLTQTAAGVYSRSAPALVMVGRWALSFDISPKGGQQFTVLVVDRAEG